MPEPSQALFIKPIQPIGLFEGRNVDASELKLTGASSRHPGELKPGQRYYFLGIGHLTAVNHREKGKEELLVREHTLSVDTALILNPKEGAKLMGEALDEHDAELERLRPQTGLFEQGDPAADVPAEEPGESELLALEAGSVDILELDEGDDIDDADGDGWDEDE